MDPVKDLWIQGKMSGSDKKGPDPTEYGSENPTYRCFLHHFLKT